MKEQAEDRSKQLPPEVCVLDIEVWRPLHWQCYIQNGFDVGWHHSKISFVGAKTFQLEEGDYRPRKFLKFRPNKLSELATFLCDFPGIIIGYNIFAWDFRMLDRSSIWHRFPFSKIIPKTFDIAAYLKGHAKLDDLGEINFGEGKTKEVRPAKDWKHVKKRKDIYKYNENDCDITFGLWRHMVFMQEISARENAYEIISLRIPDEDLPILLGKKKQMSFNGWTKLIQQIQKDESLQGKRPY